MHWYKDEYSSLFCLLLLHFCCIILKLEIIIKYFYALKVLWLLDTMSIVPNQMVLEEAW